MGAHPTCESPVMHQRAFAIPLALLLVLVPALLRPPASSAADCTFSGGFQALHDLIPDVVGDCTAPEQDDPDSGDATQPTTNGLLVYHQADNWTAFTDGATTWLNGPYGLQSRPNDQAFDWETAAPAASPSPWRVLADSQTTPLQLPAALAPDAQGNLYVADRGTHSVLKLAPDGTLVAQWGGQGSGAGQ